jgi:tetratricopeptide (TPR) repeat protein
MIRQSLILLALALPCAPIVLAQAACPPPDSMKAQFQSKPTVDALNNLGVWFGDHHQFDCAANALAASLQMDPQQKDLPHVTFMFGVSLDLSGDIKEAIPALQQAEQFGYRDIKLHVILAQALDATHMPSDAAAEWRQALEFDPELSSALDALSNDLLAGKDFAGVIQALEVPRLLGQRTEQQSLNLGAAYAATGKPDEAVRVLRDGLNTSPGSLQLANRLAATLVQLHRNGEAAALLELTVATHPEDDEAKQLLAQLQPGSSTAK